jgi:hypothetical protein
VTALAALVIDPRKWRHGKRMLSWWSGTTTQTERKR